MPRAPKTRLAPATLLTTLALALLHAGVISVQAAEVRTQDTASRSTVTAGHELYKTIGCPGRGLLDPPCVDETTTKAAKPVERVVPAKPIVEAQPARPPVAKPAPVVVPAPVVTATPAVVPAPVAAPAPAPAPAVIRLAPASMDTGAALATGAILSEQTVTAVLKDKNGNPVSDARVEWTLANAPGRVGDILKASDDAKRATSDFAITETNSRGEASVTLTSPVEGITHVLAYAPDIADPAANKAHVVRQWLDADWVMPAADGTGKVGSAQTLTTRVVRKSTGEPLPGYEVNWEVVDGPGAFFTSSRLPTATTLTDEQGQASVELMQMEPKGGENSVEVEIGRAGDAAATCCPLPTGNFAQGMTKVRWLSPELALAKSCPASVHAGDNSQIRLSVSNPGKVAADEVVVRETLPAGMTLVSAPQAQVQDGTLSWNLGSLAAGASTTLGYTARTAKPGGYAFGSAATSGEGLSASASCNVNAVAADLSITKACPAVAIVGDQVEYPVTITNKGSGEATNVLVRDVVPGGMKHASGQPVVEWKVGTLAPGASASEKFVFAAEQMGTQINTAKYSADRDLAGAAQCMTEVKKPAIDVEKSGPDKRFLGRPASYVITASNPGNAAAGNVVVTDLVPVGMSFQSAGQGGAYDAQTRSVSWKLGELAAGASARLDVTLAGERAGKPCNVATVTADRGLTDSAQVCTEVAGIPALLLEVVDNPDPVEVGSGTTYTIRVTNQGTADATNVVIQSMLADGEELVKASGASAASVSGAQVQFAPVPTLAPAQVVEYLVEVKAVKATGDVRFRVMMNADQLSDAVREEESTRLY